MWKCFIKNKKKPTTNIYFFWRALVVHTFSWGGRWFITTWWPIRITHSICSRARRQSHMTGQMSQLADLSGSCRAEGDSSALKGASECQHSNQLSRHVRLRTKIHHGESALRTEPESWRSACRLQLARLAIKFIHILPSTLLTTFVVRR